MKIISGVGQESHDGLLNTSAIDAENNKNPLLAIPDSIQGDLYQKAFRVSPLGMFFLGEKGRLWDCNEAFARMLGYDSTEKAIFSRVPGLKGDLDFNSLVEQLRLNPSMTIEWRCSGAAERTVWILVTLSIIETSDSEILIQGSAIDITARKVAEDQMRESEEHYRNIIENMSDSYWETDLAGNFTYCNGQSALFHGRSQDDLLGLNYRNYMNEETARGVYGKFNEVYKTGEPANQFCYELIRADGSKWVAEATVELRRDSEGKPIGFKGITRDVTERRQMEEALRESQLSLARAQQVAHIGNWDWNVIANEVTWSDETYRILGYAPGAFDPSTRKFGESIHEQDRDQVKAAAITAAQQGDPYNLDHRVVLPDGTIRVVNHQGEALRDEDGTIVRVIGTVQDITARKSAEVALRSSERDYKNLFENATEPIFLFDGATGRIIDGNKRASQVYGFSSAELVGIPLAELSAENKSSIELLSDLLDPANKNKEVIHRTRDGGTLVLLSNATEVVYGGQPAVLVIFRDVSEIKSLHEQLIHTEKLAALGRLLAGVAHELNNPLTSVIGYAQLLYGKVETDARLQSYDPQMNGYLQTVCNEAERCRRIVSNLLSFSRQNRPTRAAIDLKDVVERTLEMRTYEMNRNGIKLVTAFDPLPMVMGDMHQLQQVILNILLNAEQAMVSANRGGVLKVSTNQFERGGKTWVALSLSDNGPGIPQKVMDRIFEPFFTTKPVGQGTGLGLAISYGMIQEHNGTIRVENVPEGGARFVIEIPAME